MISGRGGKREGAGRKKGSGEDLTKVVRVPATFKPSEVRNALKLKDDLKSIIYAWERELHPTSPRDESAWKIVEELRKLVE